MKLKSILHKDNIYMDVEVASKAELIRYIANMIIEADIINDRDNFIIDLEQKEAEYGSGIGFGFAIPHCKSIYILKPSLIIINLKQAINYNTLDDEKIKFIFLILIPQKSIFDHHEVLAKVCRNLAKQNFREKLRQASSKEEFFKVLQTIEI